MNKSLPNVDKIKLFKRVEAGEPVVKVCGEAKISRFTYYKWHKRWVADKSENSLQDKRFNSEKHWHKASKRRELAVKEVVSGHPNWSSHKIAEFLDRKGLPVSNHGVQGILERLGLNLLEKRRNFQTKSGVTIPKTKIEKFTPEEKIKILTLYKENGEEISSICRKYGMSRYTFYKWLKRWQKSPENWQENLLSQKPKGEKHWRFLSEDKQQLVLSIVIEHPEFSVHKIYTLLKGQIGHHGIQHVFERNNLNLANLRFVYAQNQVKTEKITAVSVWFNKLKTVWESFSPSLAPAPPPFIKNNFKPFFLSFFSTCFFLLALLNWVSIFSSQTIGSQIGLFFASISLATGTIFFAYSMKYYLSLALVLSYSSRENGGGNQEQGLSDESGLGGWLRKIFGVSGKAGLPAEAKSDLAKAGGLEANLDHIKLERYPFISIHLPFYNEKKVANRIISACTSMDYPNFEVIVCDDSTDETVDIVNEWKNHPRVRILHRPTREGFKGGALSYALKAMDPRTEFVCVFDADFVPYPDSLMQFVKYFKSTGSWSEEKVFRADSIRTMSYDTFNQPVISPEEQKILDKQEKELHAKGSTAVVAGYQWHVLNKSENWVTRGVRTEYSGSYVIERPAQEIMGALKIIHGSVYCMRADVLKHFGWGTSITEDYELTLRIYEKGFRVCYTPYVQAPSECVSTIKRLIRQRMRWAEGHSFNTRKMFKRLMLNPKLTLAEKTEFAFLTPYYLQAFLFIIGTLCWLLSEVVFKVRLPFWTALWGWSLILTNFLALPLLNSVGLFLEESEEKDYMGIFSFMALCYIVVPFQAYAAVKGFIEEREGPWFRTPKSGLVTDIFTRGRFYRWLTGLIGIKPSIGALAHDRLNDDNRVNYNPYLVLATANNRFNHFSLKRQQLRWLGKTVLVSLIILSMTLSYFSFLVPNTALAASSPAFEQQINIITQPYQTRSTSYGPTDNSLGFIHWDSTKYVGDSVYLEAVIANGDWNNTGTVSLYNAAGNAVADGNIGKYGTGYERVRTSLPITLVDNTDYTVRFKSETGGISYLRAARLIILQSDDTRITDTQSQIELGVPEGTASATYQKPSQPKMYNYDSYSWNPAPSASLEATMRASSPKILQQINIIDQQYSTTSLTDVPTDNSLGLIHWDSTKYTGDSVYLEGVLRCNDWNNTATITLYDLYGNAVSGGSVSNYGNSWTRVRSSSPVSLVNNTNYTIRLKAGYAATCYVRAARLIIIQSDSVKLTETETQVELGDNEATSSSSYVQLTDKKIYNYDSSKFTPAPTAYFDATLKADPPTIEQQINISNLEYSTGTSSALPANNSLGIIYWDADVYSGETIYFEVVASADEGSGRAALFNIADGVEVASSEITVADTNNVFTRYRSSNVTLTDNTKYTVKVWHTGSSAANDITIKAARLIIVQSDTTRITNTETQVEVGNYETYSNTSYNQLTDKKIYNYDSSKFTPAPTAYFEASLKTEPPIAEQQINIINQNYSTTSSSWVPGDNSLGEIYWDADKYTGATIFFEAWLGNNYTNYRVYADLVKADNNEQVSGSQIESFASAARVRSGAISLSDDTKYSVRVRHYWGGFTASIKYARLIIVQSDPTKLQKTASYIEIGNAQSSMTGTSYSPLTDYKVYLYDNGKFTPSPVTSPGDVEFHATIKTADAGDTAYAELANCGSPCNPASAVTVAEVSTTSATAWYLGMATNVDADSDWDTTNDDEYIVRVKCSDDNGGGCSASIANAYVVLFQSDATNGITYTEIIHDYVNTLKTDTDNNYSDSDFLNQYDPLNFGGGDVNVFFEATIKTSAGTGYAQLKNDTNNKVINGSAVTTTSISYERKRSGSLRMQTTAKDYDSQLKNSAVSGNTTSVSSTRIIIQISNLVASSGVAVYANLFECSDSSCSSGTSVTGSEITTESVSWVNLRSSLITLTSGKDYVVQVKGVSGCNRIANAKIILNQTAAGGITAVELVHQQINTGVTDTDDTYTDQDFLNRFDPDTFGGSNIAAYYEATMKTSAGTAYAQLYNDTSAAAVSSTQIETTSTSYTRVRTSSDIVANTNFPSDADGESKKNIDTQIKNSDASANTTSVASSSLVVQISGLATAGVNAYAELYECSNATCTNGLSVSGSEIATASGSWTRAVSSAITLTTNKDYVVRIKTTAGLVKMANAKLIFDQSDAGGITAVEVTHQLINSLSTDADSTYSDQEYLNDYNILNFGVFPMTYYEATMKTSAGTGYSQLKNDGNGWSMSVSEISTESTSYVRVRRSADGSTGLPTADDNLEAQLKNSGSNTTSASSSWLIMQFTNIPVSGGTGYLELYECADATCSTGSSVSGSEISTTSATLNIGRSGSFSLTTGKDYVLRIKQAFIVNAKLILTQSSAGGIVATELIQQQVNNYVSDSNTDYSDQEYLNRFDPSTFSGGNPTYYFEAMIQTSAGTGYVQLRNDTDNSAVASSEMTSTSTTGYERKRTSSLTMPASAKNLETQVKNGATNTTSVISSWLIIQYSSINTSNPRIEQQVELITQEYATTQTYDYPTDNSLGLIRWDASAYDPKQVYFEAVIKNSNASGTTTALLLDSSGATVSGSTVTTSSTSYTRVRSSSAITLTDATDYTVRLRTSSSSYTATIKAARLIILQYAASGAAITATQSYIEVGNSETASSSSYGQLTGKKMYYYDSSKFNPAPTVYFEAAMSAKGAWLDSNYSRRKVVTVANNTATALTNYQTKLTIAYDSDMLANFDDLRFTTATGSALDYWIESKTDSTTATVWIEVDNIPASGTAMIYMYYGYGSATTGSNGANTFIGFDDFSGDLSKWVKRGGGCTATPTISSGELAVACNTVGEYHYGYTASPFSDSTARSDGYVVESNVQIAADTGTLGDFGFLILNSVDAGDTGYGYKGYITTMRLYGDNGFIWRRSSNTWTNLATSTWNPSTTTWYKLKTTVTSSQIYFYVYDTSDNLLTSASTSDTTLSAGLYGFRIWEQNIKADNFRVRKYASSEPSASYGSEVSYSSYSSPVVYAQLYQCDDATCTQGSAVSNSEVSVSGATWSRSRSSSLTLTTGKAYVVQIKSNIDTNFTYLANAKLILKQTDINGMVAAEIIQQQINTLATDTDATYTSKDYLNQFNPNNFTEATFNYYYEATMKTSAGTGYAQLYNVTGSDAIDTATTSQVSTTSADYERQKSSDLSSNTDWPSSAVTFDSQAKNSAASGNTTSVASSWLIIQMSGMVQIPENLLFFIPVIIFLPKLVETLQRKRRKGANCELSNFQIANYLTIQNNQVIMEKGRPYG